MNFNEAGATMRIVLPEEMQLIEKKCYESFGMTESLIIENVGQQGAQYIVDEYFQDNVDKRELPEVLVLIGKGNNGADGMAIARNLLRYHIKVRAFLLFAETEFSEELRKAIRQAISYGVKVNEIQHLGLQRDC